MSEPGAFFPSLINPAKAITIIVHGLNNKPSAMMPLVHFMQILGSDVFLVSLSGHTDNWSDPGSITRNQWLEDIFKVYTQVKARKGNDSTHRMYFLGFSLGALANLDLMCSKPGEITYDKMILLGPANALRNHAQVFQGLTKAILPGSWKIPSLVPTAYRASKFTPVQAYKILFEMERSLQKTACSQLNIPTLIFIDPKDELVSLRGLRKFIDRFNLTNWQIITIHKPLTRTSTYHHLILDEKSTGVENWSLIQASIRSFLNEL
jgi:esterase/lipase